jgi:hypothetical protein
MRVYPLGDKLFDNIRSKLREIDKHLPQKVLADKAAPTGLLIILGDGREDNIVVPLICHHLNGNKTAAILKPTSTRYGAIQTLKTIVKNYKAIAFILDQENDELPSLSETVMRKLNEIGAECEVKENLVGGRVVRYECILGDHRFRFVVVVNGLDDVGGPSHKIEDHLVRLAGVAVRGDSKDAWNGLGDVGRLEVFRKIYADRDVAAEVFSQHFEGLGLLDR